MSEDPIGFNGDASNLNRYVGNAPTNAIVPRGLAIRKPLRPSEGNDRRYRRRSPHWPEER